MNSETFICRLCLTTEGITVNIYEHLVRSEKIFFDQLANLLFELKIQKNDGLPDKICSTCLIRTYQFCFFKRHCQDSESILHQTTWKNQNLKAASSCSPSLLANVIFGLGNHEKIEKVNTCHKAQHEINFPLKPSIKEETNSERELRENVHDLPTLVQSKIEEEDEEIIDPGVDPVFQFNSDSQIEHISEKRSPLIKGLTAEDKSPSRVCRDVLNADARSSLPNIHNGSLGMCIKSELTASDQSNISFPSKRNNTSRSLEPLLDVGEETGKRSGCSQSHVFESIDNEKYISVKKEPLLPNDSPLRKDSATDKLESSDSRVVNKTTSSKNVYQNSKYHEEFIKFLSCNILNENNSEEIIREAYQVGMRDVSKDCVYSDTVFENQEKQKCKAAISNPNNGENENFSFFKRERSSYSENINPQIKSGKVCQGLLTDPLLSSAQEKELGDNCNVDGLSDAVFTLLNREPKAKSSKQPDCIDSSPNQFSADNCKIVDFSSVNEMCIQRKPSRETVLKTVGKAPNKMFIGFKYQSLSSSKPMMKYEESEERMSQVKTLHVPCNTPKVLHNSNSQVSICPQNGALIGKDIQDVRDSKKSLTSSKDTLKEEHLKVVSTRENKERSSSSKPASFASNVENSCTVVSSKESSVANTSDDDCLVVYVGKTYTKVESTPENLNPEMNGDVNEKQSFKDENFGSVFMSNCTPENVSSFEKLKCDSLTKSADINNTDGNEVYETVNSSRSVPCDPRSNDSPLNKDKKSSLKRKPSADQSSDRFNSVNVKKERIKSIAHNIAFHNGDLIKLALSSLHESSRNGAYIKTSKKIKTMDQGGIVDQMNENKMNIQSRSLDSSSIVRADVADKSSSATVSSTCANQTRDPLLTRNEKTDLKHKASYITAPTHGMNIISKAHSQLDTQECGNVVNELQYRNVNSAVGDTVADRRKSHDHNKVSHSIESRFFFPCSDCPLSFATLESLQSHITVHKKTLNLKGQSNVNDVIKTSEKTHKTVCISSSGESKKSSNSGKNKKIIGSDNTKRLTNCMNSESAVNQKPKLNFPVDESSCKSSCTLRTSRNEPVIKSFKESYQNDDIVEDRIQEGRKLIEHKLLINDLCERNHKSKCFRCPACFNKYNEWKLIISHIVSNHQCLSKEWPISLLFYPEIFHKWIKEPNTAAEPEHSYESFICDKCSQSFYAKIGLLKHKIWIHGAS